MMNTIFALLLACLLCTLPAFATVKLPAGFQIETLQDNVPDARSLAMSPSGIIFVGSRGSEGVRAIVHPSYYKGKLKAGVAAFGKELNMPNGVAVRKGHLYVAEVARILKYADIEKQLESGKFKYEVLRGDLPDKEHHGWKYLNFGPDGWLYFGIGAPCNICRSPDKRFASISKVSEDGKQFEVYAHGIRNSVGFDWDSKGKMYFTDNGRDWMGDENPNDELNSIDKADQHFGFPYCHDGEITDPEFGKEKPCSNEFVKPHTKMGPHVAAIGMKFYKGSQFPKEYRGRIFIAQHGSWNRTNKIGYRVVTVDPAKPGSMEVFAEGWLQDNGNVDGRPVDVLETPDGSLLISDDHAGKIYRVRYQKKP
jgi:glucose/arabinose dehydrogenase